MVCSNNREWECLLRGSAWPWVTGASWPFDPLYKVSRQMASRTLLGAVYITSALAVQTCLQTRPLEETDIALPQPSRRDENGTLNVLYCGCCRNGSGNKPWGGKRHSQGGLPGEEFELQLTEVQPSCAALWMRTEWVANGKYRVTCDEAIDFPIMKVVESSTPGLVQCCAVCRLRHVVKQHRQCTVRITQRCGAFA